MRDPLFDGPPAGPDPASWGAAAFRSFHPVRWGLGLAGLAATATIAALFQSLFDGQTPRLADWFAQPARQVPALAEHLAGRTTLGVVLRLGTVVAVFAAVWSIVGGWIARHELLARHSGGFDATADPVEPGPTGLVTRRLKDLVTCVPLVLALCALLIQPVVLAGLLNRLGGVGAILVAVFLPAVLVADLVLLCIAGGLVASPLMPVTLAAENSDTFDALSRTYNYSFQRPVRFILLTALTLAGAALPTVGVLLALAGPMANWPAAAGHPAVWVAAGLSASLFWSLQTLTYLNLRTAVDGVDADQVAGGAEPAPAAPRTEAGQRPTPATTAMPPARFRLLTQVVVLGIMLATWFLTAWLFARFGGENAGWLGWGVGEHFRPPAEGAYWFASLLAGAWGVIWVVAPVLVAVRQMLRPEARDAAAKLADEGGSAEPLLE